MKIKIDDRVIFELDDIKKAIFKDIIFEEDFESEIERLVKWVLEHNLSNITRSLREKWMPLLGEMGIDSIPTSDEGFARVIFKHKSYKNRSKRDKKFPDKIKSISDLPPGR